MVGIFIEKEYSSTWKKATLEKMMIASLNIHFIHYLRMYPDMRYHKHKL